LLVIYGVYLITLEFKLSVLWVRDRRLLWIVCLGIEHALMEEVIIHWFAYFTETMYYSEI
jgi:hypothetical protein